MPFYGAKTQHRRQRFMESGGDYTENLVLWCRARSIPLGPDTLMDRWDDDSGNGDFGDQQTGAWKPILKAGLVNGMEGVRFDGVDDTLVVPYTRHGGKLSPSTLTIFMVVIPRETTEAVYYLYHRNAVAITWSAWAFEQEDGQYKFRMEDNGISTNKLNLGAFAVGQAAILEGKYDGATMSGRLNGGTSVSVGHSIYYGGNFDVYLGSHENSTWACQLDIVEVRIYNVALSSSQDARVLDRLNRDYAVF